MALGTRPAGTCHSPVSATSPTWQGRLLELEEPSVFPAWPAAHPSGALQSAPHRPGPTHPLSLVVGFPASPQDLFPPPHTPHAYLWAPHLACSSKNLMDALELKVSLPPWEKAWGLANLWITKEAINVLGSPAAVGWVSWETLFFLRWAWRELGSMLMCHALPLFPGRSLKDLGVLGTLEVQPSR